MLRAAGLTCIAHDDQFPQDADDVEWIPPVAQNEWFAISRDNRIKKTEEEKKIVIATGLGLFLLTQGKRTVKEMGEHFVLALPMVDRYIKRKERPFIVSVRPPRKGHKRGELYTIYPPSESN